MNILFTCAGRRNYLINYFKKAIGNNGFIFAADMQASAPALIDSDKAFVVPGIYQENYIETLLTICKSESVNAVISLNDLELPILAKEREKFENIGVKIIVSSEKVIDITFDKYKTFQFAKGLNINTPKTYLTIDETLKSIDEGELSYPVILKPRWGSASIGIEIVYTEEELVLAYRLLAHRIDRSILAEASKEAKDEAILIQEYITGQEFGLDIINDLDGNYRATIVKKKLAMRAGETDKAMTVYNKELIDIGETIGKALAHKGNLDSDFFFSNGLYYLLELNSRFGGGYPFTHEAGANVPLAIIKWLQGENVSDDIFKVCYGKAFSKYDCLMNVNINE